MRTYSACVPSILLPRIQPPVAQCEYMPRRHASHLPHDEMHEISTRSPGPNADTAAPTCSTTPTPSCPSTRPGSQLGTSPLRICRSVPQMVVCVTRTIASVAAASVGAGRSSSDFFPGP